MNVQTLTTELAAEIAEVKPFADLTTAVSLLNGRNGGTGIRYKYLSMLYAAPPQSDVLTQNIGAEINRLCDSEIALLTPIQHSTP